MVIVLLTTLNISLALAVILLFKIYTKGSDEKEIEAIIGKVDRIITDVKSTV